VKKKKKKIKKYFSKTHQNDNNFYYLCHNYQNDGQVPQARAWIGLWKLQPKQKRI